MEIWTKNEVCGNGVRNGGEGEGRGQKEVENEREGRSRV